MTQPVPPAPSAGGALARMRKAIVAGLGAGAAAYANGVLDGSMSQSDWIVVVGSVLVVGVVTYAVPNKLAPEEKS